MTLFFVTGTDTEVGKTTVAAALLHHAITRSKHIWAWKPIESGCAEENGVLTAADATALADAAGVSAEFGVPAYSFRDPVAPGVAAERTGVAIDLPSIAARAQEAAATADFAIVEGAGGLLVPLSPSEDIADLAAAIRAPLIVIARAGLGTINHTLLTLSVASARGLAVAAVILNDTSPDTPHALIESNLHELRRRTSTPILGALPYAPVNATSTLREAIADLNLAALGLA